MFIAAVITNVCQPVVKMLMADDRVVRNIAALELCIETQIAFLNGLSMRVWTRLARGVGPACVARDFRSDCLRAAYTYYGFFYFRCLKVAKGYPFCLGIGDVKQNLRDLAAEGLPPRADLNTRKIYQMVCQ